MKKILLSVVLFLLLLFPVKTVFAETSFPMQVRVIYNTADVYSTTEIFSLSNSQLEAVTLKTLKLHEVIEVNGESGDFYCLEVDGHMGYILKTLVIDNNEKSPVKTLETNATISKNCELFENADDSTPVRTLQAGTKVRILDGYDKKREYTQISFQENETIYTFYVKTDALSVKGINYIAIVAVSTILAGISISLIIIKIVKPKPIVKVKK